MKITGPKITCLSDCNFCYIMQYAHFTLRLAQNGVFIISAILSENANAIVTPNVLEHEHSINNYCDIAGN